MNSIYFTAGPSQIYPSYANHLADAMHLQLGSINHRSERFRKIYQHTDEQLRVLLNLPKSHSIFFASSATEIWEKILLNLVDQHSFHLVNGSFSSKFFDFAQQLQKTPTAFNVNEGKGFNLNDFQIPDITELICTTQNETSTGVYLPSEDLKKLKQVNPQALICTDLVSIAPYSNIDYDFMDCSFFSVQKAFGMPPGLGVWIVNEACDAKSEKMQQQGKNIGAHNTLASYKKNYNQFETPSTPNVIAIYILGKIAEDMNKKGISIIRNEMNAKASMVYEMAEKHSIFSPFVREQAHRSTSVAVLNTQVDSTLIIAEVKKQNMHISNGYGTGKGKQVRIANFPATSLSEMESLIKALNSIAMH